MSELSQERVALDVIYQRVVDAETRVNEAKRDILYALTIDDMKAGTAQLLEAAEDRVAWGEIHAGYWHSIGEPGPTNGCGVGCDSNCGC